MFSHARISSAFIAACLGAALAGAPPARAIDEYGPQFPYIETVGGPGCDDLCHATGGTSSPLYIDFEAAGFAWNPTFASADSDGDGFSNGWELQNPSGSWISGTPYLGNAAFVSNPANAGALPPLPVASAPTAIEHSEAAGDDGTESFVVQNVGAVPFDYALSPSDDWMSPDPASATALPPNEQDSILLSFATSGLLEGLYQGSVAILVPGIRADRIPPIPVDLTVPEPGALAAQASAIAVLTALARRRVGRGHAHRA